MQNVLKDFSKEDRTWLEPLLDGIADGVDRLIAGDDAGFQNRVAIAVKPPRPNAKRPDETADVKGKKD